MFGEKQMINKHPLWIYFVLVFIISWGIVLLVAGPNGFPVAEGQAMVLGMAILLGPSISGMILTGLFGGKSGYQNLFISLIKVRVHIKWYAIAFLTAPLTTGISVGILYLFSPKYLPAILVSPEKSGLIMGALIGGLFVALFEELGWTNFAVPKLVSKYSIMKSGVFLGLIWGLWHFPLFWQENSFTELFPFLLLLAKLFSWLPAYRVLMIWVYDKTSSFFLIILMHASLVASLMLIDPPVKGIELFVFILVRAVLLWGVCFGVLFLDKKK